MDNRGDILQLCRLCLVKDDVNTPIFEEQGDIRQIFLKISSCLPVKVSRDDKLPKKICDGCSYKLDMLYEFWNTTANAEKQLLTWLGEAGMNAKMTDGTISAVAQQIKPVETVVKQEALDPSDIHGEEHDDKSYMFQQKFTEEDAGPSATVTSNEEEPPPPKRARRTAAVKAQIAMDPDSDEDDDSGEPLTKVEDESEYSEGDDHEPAFVDVPSTSTDDQPGPSGVGKDGGEAPRSFLSKNQKCAHCCTEFKTEYQLYKHKYEQHSEGMTPCDMCGKLFSSLQNLSYHKSMRHFKQFVCQCNLCGMFCENKNALRKHIDLFHWKKSAFFCRDCDLAFDFKKAADQHFQEVHQKRGFEYTCEVCHKPYRNKICFEEHVKSHDPEYGKVKLECKLCNRQFLRPTALTAHMNVKHKREKMMYVCEICGKSVTSHNSLVNHRRTHTGEKPYDCQLCDKSFTTKPLLRQHIRSHTKEKRYSCEICKKRFTQSSTLTIHMRYHSGERPYECQICVKKFVSHTIMKNHKCKMNNVR